ncbi:MAG: aldehyde dehydrogenase family protein, partial [Chitinophagaceae bacterium]
MITEKKKLKSFSPVTADELDGEFNSATIQEIAEAAQQAARAFTIYARTSPVQRAAFLEAIGQEILSLGDVLISRAMLETGLPEARLIGERGRTITQLQLFADILREGSWVEAVIDPALPERKPLPRADIRKMLVPIGPVLIFGASNFPFAFSTAGGDTASALAAGNPVIVKAHEGHLGTNQLVGNAILTAAQKTGMPSAVFSYLVIGRLEEVQGLIRNEAIKAIGFTGSYKAGMSIFHTATTARRTPIPVYAEMSSVNPVLILPEVLNEKAE